MGVEGEREPPTPGEMKAFAPYIKSWVTFLWVPNTHLLCMHSPGDIWVSSFLEKQHPIRSGSTQMKLSQLIFRAYF